MRIHSGLYPVFLTALLTGACATVKTGVDFDEVVDFSQYRTAAWARDEVMVSRMSEPVSPLTTKRIRTAIEAELARRGIVFQTETEGAGLSVIAVAGAREKLDRKVYPVRYRADGYWCGVTCYEPEYIARTYTEGTLSVDLFDAASGEPIWHGWAKKSITNADRENPKRGIEDAVSKIFDGFPPSP